MCGRFTLRTPTPVLIEHFGLGRIPHLPERFNVAPTQEIPVIRLDRDSRERELAMLRWGLIPSWAKDEKIGARMINARAETVAEKPAFRAAFRRRRCLIPADGFYEWRKTGGKSKQPYYIHRADDAPFAFAGLWERWGDEEPIESCTVITTDANQKVSELHDRMPAILSPGDYDLWLDADSDDKEALTSLLDPYPDEETDLYPVSTFVNNARHEGRQCLERQQTLF